MYPSQINPFTNQDNDSINQGNDFKGDLLHYSEELLSREID